MKRINVNLFPRDGYFFKDQDGAVIRGENWSSVMRRVEAYRKRNGYAVGNVENEVSAQACARNPSHCSDINDATIHQTKIVSLKGRVLKYLGFIRSLLPSRVPWVSATEAARRAGICAGCPQNTPLPEGCASCRAALNAMRNEILGPHRARDSRLNGCAILGEDLPTCVHVDHDVVDSPELPHNCWRRQRPPA